MTFFVDSDAVYLVLPNAKNRIIGFFYMSSTPPTNEQPMLNAPILVMCKTLRNVVSSIEESESSGVFMKAHVSLSIRHYLECLDHPQPQTPLKSDNSKTTGFFNNNMQQKRYKS